MSSKYPFQPKSTAYMKVGQFWPISLKSGGFACGRVLGFEQKNGNRKRVSFLAGLMDWSGTSEPTQSSLVGIKVLEQRVVHIYTITKHYGTITGIRDTDSDGIEPLLWVEHQGGPDWGLYKGMELIKTLSKEEADLYPKKKTGGYNVMNILENKELKTPPIVASGSEGCAPGA